MSKYTNIYELYSKVMENADSINSRKAGIVNEDVKKDAVKAFDKVKPKQTLDIGYDSSISSNMSNKFVVKSKRKVKMGSDGMGEKITMQRIDPKSGNPSGGMKYFLYKRPNGDVSLALGDMGASMKSIKIEGYNEEKDLTLDEDCDTLDLDENFSPKEVKMAIGIASDPRYKQGNMTGAVRAIEKIKKNLSKHSQVAAVLKRQNEELLAYVKEGKMKNIATEVDDAMGNIAYKLDTKGGRFVVKVDSNDEEDAQKAMKMHPLYIAGKLRVVPEEVELEGYKPIKANHYDVKVTVKDKDVAKVKKIISLFNGDIEDVDSDQVDGGGMKFKGTGDIFIQGDDAGKLGMEIAKAVRTAKVMGEEVELDEMVMKYVLINMQGKVQGYASDKKDALDIAKRTKSTMHPIKKKITDKTLEKMNALAKTPKELQDLGIIDEGKAVSRAQQAAIAISKKERGEKPKNEKVDPADIDDFATDDDVKQADNNILMQLRKTISLRGMKDVKFLDNKKVKVKEPIARAVFDRYSKLRTSIEKRKFQTQIAKSYKDLLNALKK